MLQQVWAVVCRHPILTGYVLLGAALGILQQTGARSNVLADAVGDLTPEQQRLLFLRFFADLSASEIAKLMGKRQDDVRLLQLHALSRLQHLLATQRR